MKSVKKKFFARTENLLLNSPKVRAVEAKGDGGENPLAIVSRPASESNFEYLKERYMAQDEKLSAYEKEREQMRQQMEALQQQNLKLMAMMNNFQGDAATKRQNLVVSNCQEEIPGGGEGFEDEGEQEEESASNSDGSSTRVDVEAPNSVPEVKSKLSVHSIHGAESDHDESAVTKEEFHTPAETFFGDRQFLSSQKTGVTWHDSAEPAGSGSAAGRRLLANALDEHDLLTPSSVKDKLTFFESMSTSPLDSQLKPKREQSIFALQSKSLVSQALAAFQEKGDAEPGDEYDDNGIRKQRFSGDTNALDDSDPSSDEDERDPAIGRILSQRMPRMSLHSLPGSPGITGFNFQEAQEESPGSPRSTTTASAGFRSRQETIERAMSAEFARRGGDSPRKSLSKRSPPRPQIAMTASVPDLPGDVRDVSEGSRPSSVNVVPPRSLAADPRKRIVQGEPSSSAPTGGSKYLSRLDIIRSALDRREEPGDMTDSLRRSLPDSQLSLIVGARTHRSKKNRQQNNPMSPRSAFGPFEYIASPAEDQQKRIFRTVSATSVLSESSISTGSVPGPSPKSSSAVEQITEEELEDADPRTPTSPRFSDGMFMRSPRRPMSTQIRRPTANTSDPSSSVGRPMSIRELATVRAATPIEMLIGDDDPESYPYDEDDQDSNILFDSVESRNANSSCDIQLTIPISYISVEKLIQKVTTVSDPNLVFVFLLTYKTMMSPNDVLLHLMRRFNIPTPANMTQEEEDIFNLQQRLATQLRVVSVLKHWIERYGSDLRESEATLAMLRNFIDTVIAHNPGTEAAAQVLRKVLERHMSTTTETSGALAGGGGQIVAYTTPTPTKDTSLLAKAMNAAANALSPSSSLTPGKIHVLDVHEAELARQLTLIEYQLLRSIGGREFIGQAWAKTKREKMAPNILLMIERFNTVSRWVSTEILKSSNLKQRVATVRKFIKVAGHCHAMNNFNGCMEIISGLNFGPVYRLHKTWEGLSNRRLMHFQSLDALMSAEQNHKIYREELRQCNGPAVPYLGVFLKDLVFIDDLPENIPKMINFKKRRRMAAVVLNLQEYQKQPYPFRAIPALQSYLKDLQLHSDDELYALSFQYEPRKCA